VRKRRNTVCVSENTRANTPASLEDESEEESEDITWVIQRNYKDIDLITDSIFLFNSRT